MNINNNEYLYKIKLKCICLGNIVYKYIYIRWI